MPCYCAADATDTGNPSPVVGGFQRSTIHLIEGIRWITLNQARELLLPHRNRLEPSFPRSNPPEPLFPQRNPSRPSPPWRDPTEPSRRFSNNPTIIYYRRLWMHSRRLRKVIGKSEREYPSEVCKSPVRNLPKLEKEKWPEKDQSNRRGDRPTRWERTGHGRILQRHLDSSTQLTELSDMQFQKNTRFSVCF